MVPQHPIHQRLGKGFSLIELLVVCAILAALAFLTLPLGSSLLEHNREVRCASKMTTLANAIFLYAAEHGGRLPPAHLDGTGTRPDNVWTHVIHPYLGVQGNSEPEITRKMSPHLACPAERARENWNPPSQFWHTHYGVNGSGPLTFNFDGSSQRPSLDQPSRTMMLIETRNARGVRARTSSIASIVARHNGLANVVFFDGHLEKRDLASIPSNGGDPFWKEW